MSGIVISLLILFIIVFIFSYIVFRWIVAIINTTISNEENPMGCGGKAKKKTKRK